MVKETSLHLLIFLGLLFLTVLLYLLPDPVPQYAAMLLWLTAAAMLASMLCGEFYGVLISLLIPAFIWYMFERETFPASGIREAASALCGCLACGMFYRFFHVTFRAFIAGVLASRIAYALTGFVLSVIFRNTARFTDFVREGIVNVWPGLILCLILLPLLVGLFRKQGLMFILRDESRS